MFFLLSGEGITDLGVGNKNSIVCEGEHFIVGPMTVIVDQIVEKCLGYSTPISAKRKSVTLFDRRQTMNRKK